MTQNESHRSIHLLLSCEHASQFVPKRFQTLIAASRLDTHQAYDIGAKQLTRALARKFRCPAFYGGISRLLIDLNRSPGHKNLYNGQLSSTDRKLLWQHYYQPFRASVRQEIMKLKTKDSSTRILHLSIHSFSRDFQNKRRSTDIGILYDNRRTLEMQGAKALQQELRHLTSYQVNRNRPYWGRTDGHTSGLRQIYDPEDYCGFELEVCQDLLEAKHQPIMAATLHQAIQSMLSSLMRNSG